jgi:RNase H-like domain found in reverse transcriptase
MLSFLDYTLPFKIFSDTLKHQVRAIIAQETEKGLKPAAFFAAKMTSAQHCYTVTEQAIRSISMLTIRI